MFFLKLVFSSFWASILSRFRLVLGRFWGAKTVQNWYQNPSWRPGGVSVRLRAVLEPSWGGLGAYRGGLGVVLGRLGEVLGWSWGVSGRSWGGLGASWGALGVFLGRLGLVLGRLVAQKAAERFKKARSGLFGLLGAVQFCFCIVQALQSVISLLWRTQAARGALKRRFPFSAAQVWGRGPPPGEAFSIIFQSFFELRFLIDF